VLKLKVCPDDGAFQYSSDFVFDRNGVLLARYVQNCVKNNFKYFCLSNASFVKSYRKTHLFLEPLFQVPPATDLTVFSTDFGINFGMMTCFDIMFYEPALTLYYQQGIKDFVFPTAWVDELPFLTGR
jgi:predicted amidohydrolase